MPKIIAISNQKGGVGKTTTTSALAVGLKHKGFHVLAIDLDPQGNLGFCLGAETENHATIYEVLKGEIGLVSAIQRTSMVDVVTSSILLSGIELEFTNTGREYLLRDAIEPIAHLYDYILIDTPPALSILTVNAFTAADYIVVTMLADIFSLQGIAQLYESVGRVKKYCNPRLEIAGILLTRFNPRTVLSNEIKGTAALISENLNIPLFNTFIRTSVAISEAQSLQKDIIEYAPKANGIKDYLDFVDELLARGI